MTASRPLPRVLFVDDEPQLLEGLRGALRRQRRVWNMAFADGGAAALAILADGPVDILCTDMRMPGMDGAELLARVRQVSPRTGRFVLSGYVEEKRLATCLALAHHFFHKPFEVSLLVSVLERAVAVQAAAYAAPATQLAERCQLGALDVTPYMRLTELFAAGRACHADAVAIIDGCPGLAEKVVELGARAVAGEAGPATPGLRALIDRLGLEPARALVLYAQLLLEAEARGTGARALAAAATRAVLTARIARRLVGAKAGYDAFTAGLLCGAGDLLPTGDAEPAARAALAAHRLWPLGLALPVLEAIALPHPPESTAGADLGLPAAVGVAAALARGEADTAADAAVRGRLPAAWRTLASEEAAAVEAL